MEPVSVMHLTHCEHTHEAFKVLMVTVRVGLWLGLTLTLLITMIIQHFRHIITHYNYVHNALQMHALSKMLPKIPISDKWADIDTGGMWLSITYAKDMQRQQDLLH